MLSKDVVKSVKEIVASWTYNILGMINVVKVSYHLFLLVSKVGQAPVDNGWLYYCIDYLYQR